MSASSDAKVSSRPYIRNVRRNTVSRAFAAIVSVWLAISLAEPAQLHTCPKHGGLAIGAANHSPTHTAATTHGGGAAHHDAIVPDAAANQSHHDGPGDHSNQCSCLGDCSIGNSSPGLPVAAARIAVPAAVRLAAAYAYATPALVAPEFLLPFPNGPPVISSRA